MERRHRFVRLVTAVAVATGVVAAAGIGTAGAQKTKELAVRHDQRVGRDVPPGLLRRVPGVVRGRPAERHGELPEPGRWLGKGRQEFADQVTQWGASDAPYPAADLSKVKGGSFLYVPTVTAPITVSYNVSGVTKPLKFTRSDAREDLPGLRSRAGTTRRSPPTTPA